MTNKDLYKKAFDTIVKTEICEMEDLFMEENAKNRKTGTKRKTVSKFVGFAAALGVLLAGTIVFETNAASTIKNYFAEMFFGRPLTVEEEQIVEERTTQFKDDMGEQIKIVDNQATVEPLEVICDGRMLYISLKITADENAGFMSEKGTYLLHGEEESNFFPSYPGSYTGGDLDDSVQIISEKEMIISQLFELNRKDEINEELGQDRIVLPEEYHFNGLWLKAEDGTISNVLTGDYTIDLDILVDFASVETTECGMAELTQFAFYPENESALEGISKENIYVTMQDGTKIYTQENSLQWSQLIDTVKIKSFHLGESEYLFWEG